MTTRTNSTDEDTLAFIRSPIVSGAAILFPVIALTLRFYFDGLFLNKSILSVYETPGFPFPTGNCLVD